MSPFFKGNAGPLSAILAEHYTILEPQHLLLGDSELQNNLRSTDFGALKS